MSKAILIMDMPESCGKCPCVNDAKTWCLSCNRIASLLYEPRPEWCPLGEVPEYRDEGEEFTVADYFRAQGFNACIDEILGGNDEKQRTD